jgi:hypothetical protein
MLDRALYKASADIFACVIPLFHYQQHRGGSTGRSTFDTDIYIALKYIPTKASLNLIYLATLRPSLSVRITSFYSHNHQTKMHPEYRYVPSRKLTIG